MSIPRAAPWQVAQAASFLSLTFSNFLVFQGPSYTDLADERRKMQNRMTNIETKMARPKILEAVIENELGPVARNFLTWVSIRRRRICCGDSIWSWDP